MMWNFFAQVLVSLVASLFAQVGEQALNVLAHSLVRMLLRNCSSDVREQVFADFDARSTTVKRIAFSVSLISARIVLASRWRRRNDTPARNELSRLAEARQLLHFVWTESELYRKEGDPRFAARVAHLRSLLSEIRRRIRELRDARMRRYREDSKRA